MGIMTLHSSPCQLAYFFFEWLILQLINLFKGPTPRTEENVHGKVVVVTGANSGLGKHTAEEMAKRGAKVIIACRNMTEGKKALEDIKRASGSTNVELVELDLCDLDCVRKCAETIKTTHSVVDILINNAGISINDSPRRFTKNGFEMNMGTNHIGHFLLTDLLLDNIKAAQNGRIITVSSTAFVMSNLDIDDLMMDKFHNLGLLNTMPYNNSKFANALFNKELSKRLRNTRVKCYALCPGLVKSNVFRHYTGFGKYFVSLPLNTIGLPVEKASDMILYCATAKGIENMSGKMFRFGKVFSSMETLLKDELATRLWSKTEDLIKNH